MKTEKTDKTESNQPTTVEIVQAASAALSAVERRMPFLRKLTPLERRQHGRVGPQMVRLTTHRLQAAQAHPEAVPAAFSLPQFREQTDMLLALIECAAVAERIHRGAQGALIAHGADAIQSGREVAALRTADATTTVKVAASRPGAGPPQAASGDPSPPPALEGPATKVA